MSDFSDFCAQIAEYANRGDWAPAIVTGFVRQAEEKLNAELRIDRMIQFDQALIASRCAPLPDDWLQMELVRIANPNVPDGFIPIRYKSRDEFFTTVDNWAYGFYTIQGARSWVGGSPDTINGQIVKLTYYGEVPVFSDATPSWVYSKYPALFLEGGDDVLVPACGGRGQGRGREAAGRGHDHEAERAARPRARAARGHTHSNTELWLKWSDYQRRAKRRSSAR